MSTPPENHELSEGLRGEIIGMCKVKTSFAEIGRILQVNESTARKIWNRYQETGSYVSAPRSGRPPKLTDLELRHIVRHVRHDRDTRRQPLAEITEVLNINISTKTIQRRFEEIGLGHYIERKKPYLSNKQKTTRLEFAQKHIHWGIEEWRRVIWTDEMQIQTDANEGQV
jgi:transposase